MLFLWLMIVVFNLYIIKFCRLNCTIKLEDLSWIYYMDKVKGRAASGQILGTPHGTTLFKFRATMIVAKQFPYIHDSLQP